MKNIAPKSFYDLIRTFNFNRISIDSFYRLYVYKEAWVTKQMITRWLSEEADKRHLLLVKRRSSNIIYYTFDPKDISINEDMIRGMQCKDQIVINNEDVDYAKKLIKSLRFSCLGKFKVRLCEDNITRIFRTA